MREIMFRQFFNGTFHYWGYVNNVFIMPLSTSEAQGIESDQDTGLKDKNGTRIFERDIVRWLGKKDSLNDVEIFHFGCVIYKLGHFRANSQTYHLSYRQCSDLENTDVIGNAHQHPHLLGENK